MSDLGSLLFKRSLTNVRLYQAECPTEERSSLTFELNAHAINLCFYSAKAPFCKKDAAHVHIEVFRFCFKAKREG